MVLPGINISKYVGPAFVMLLASIDQSVNSTHGTQPPKMYAHIVDSLALEARGSNNGQERPVAQACSAISLGCASDSHQKANVIVRETHCTWF